MSGKREKSLSSAPTIEREMAPRGFCEQVAAEWWEPEPVSAVDGENFDGAKEEFSR